MKIPYVFSWEKKGNVISWSIGPIPFILLYLVVAMLLLGLI